MPKVSFRLSETLQAAVDQALRDGRAEGYHLRRKGVWISEALVALVAQDPALRSVGIGSRLEQYPVLSRVTLNEEGIGALREAIRRLRRHSPLFDTSQSEIIRSAIRYRLGNPGAVHPVNDTASGS